MRRLVALSFGAIAGLVAVALFRRRRRASQALSGDVSQPDGALGAGDDQASQLRRKLDEAREAGGESVGQATEVEDDAGDESTNGEPDDPATAEPETLETANGGSTGGLGDATKLADRRADVHGRAREAADSMRDDDSGAA